jgi:exo-beta-1,3-glucanase (GH17 family)
MSASDYAETVGPVLERVKALGLPARMVLAGQVDGADTSWMETLYTEIPRLNSLYYAFAEHPYWYGHDPAAIDDEGPFQRIVLLRRRMDDLGATAKPIFITEYGESTASCGEQCVSEATQARHLGEMIRFCRRTALDVQLLSIFQLIDRGTDSGDRELQFGILRQNGSPKPSYGVVRQAISG